jgi:hypothetical protein
MSEQKFIILCVEDETEEYLVWLRDQILKHNLMRGRKFLIINKVIDTLSHNEIKALRDTLNEILK